MQKGTLTLGLLAAIAVIAGLAVGFFELTIAGAAAALVAVALWLKATRPATKTGTLR